MTAEEFKKIRPEYANVEGDQLWDAMTMHMLQQQQASEIIKQIKPIWKTHTLRWLYYRRIPNLVMGKPSTDKWVSDKRCSKCKWGVNMRMCWSFRDADDKWHSHSVCPHCNGEYVAEPNTNITHKLYKAWKWMSKLFWKMLDKLHLVRSSIHGRYDMFGDEQRYVAVFKLNFKTGKTTYEFKKRKWWEYMLIEKPFHNF